MKYNEIDEHTVMAPANIARVDIFIPTAAILRGRTTGT